MEARVLFALSVLVYAAIPLVVALAPPRYRFMLFYVYITTVLTLGGLLGAIYVLPLGGDVSLLAGQVAYGAFMYSTFIAVIVGRDVQVVRSIVVLSVAVNVLVWCIFAISHRALDSADVVNVVGTSPEIFDRSVDTVLTGGLLIIVELVLFVVVLDRAKARVGTRSMVPVYLATYVGILALDGVLYPLIALRPDTGLGDLIHDQVISKLVLACAFAAPLLVFVLCYRPAVRGFEGANLYLRHLLHVTRDELLARIDHQRAELADQRERIVRSDQDAVHATATVSTVLDAATDTLLAAVDPNLRFTAFNAGAERLLGRSRSEVIGRSPAMFVTPAEIARHAAELGVEADLAQVLGAQVVSGERRDWELVVGDDERLMASLSAREIQVDGELVGFVIAGVDITERLETEMALQSALEIEKGSLSRLREADGVKRAVVSTVSHELRTPIASILGYTELMVDGDFGDLTPEQRRAIDRVRGNATRLTRIVDDLLTLDRAEHLPLHLDLQRIDLREVVTSYVEDLGPLFDRHGHALVVELPGAPVWVSADLHGLHRVLGNLVGNAVKFSPDPGEVTLRVDTTEDEPSLARLAVVDTGIGIAEADQDQLFDRFFRAEEAATRAIPGSGLGLAIVKAVIEDHGGRIKVVSTPGVGTMVTVLLPLTEPTEPTEATS